MNSEASRMYGANSHYLANSDTNEARLSARETEILRWVALGKTNPEIGSILGISVFTVKNHVQRILKKLDVTNRTHAVGKTNSFLNYG